MLVAGTSLSVIVASSPVATTSRQPRRPGKLVSANSTAPSRSSTGVSSAHATRAVCSPACPSHTEVA